jgi:hypothetical protein
MLGNYANQVWNQHCTGNRCILGFSPEFASALLLQGQSCLAKVVLRQRRRQSRTLTMMVGMNEVKFLSSLLFPPSRLVSSTHRIIPKFPPAFRKGFQSWTSWSRSSKASPPEIKYKKRFWLSSPKPLIDFVFKSKHWIPTQLQQNWGDISNQVAPESSQPCHWADFRGREDDVTVHPWCGGRFQEGVWYWVLLTCMHPFKNIPT